MMIPFFISALLSLQQMPKTAQKPVYFEMSTNEQKKLPLIIAKSIKEQYQGDFEFDVFTNAFKQAKHQPSYEISTEIQTYLDYIHQIQIDPQIKAANKKSVAYLRKQQNLASVISIIQDRIAYQVIKQGMAPGIETNSDYEVRINFTMTSIDGVHLAGNYALNGPFVCHLIDLIPGMTHGIRGMSIHEVREIYIHPEFAYGMFSHFANGEALCVQVELLACAKCDVPLNLSLLPVDLTVKLPSSLQIQTMRDLHRQSLSYCAQKLWRFYSSHLSLDMDAVAYFLDNLHNSDSLEITLEEREILHKFQWLISFER